MDNILKQKTISFKDTNGEKRYNKTITLTKNGESKTYFRITPGVSDFTIKDVKNYIKYKGEHYV
jgi:hypothetical protein